ncbi:flagellar type III secretion system pore protein FliP [Pseudoroseicyclus sp. CXY001]|uniref:flagellar type III secretion system pore protein FliP n=1 Tax=Pseudoroseicyclus sp. CXY001 TaxID=3242492 RepID=UPI00357167E6
MRRAQATGREGPAPWRGPLRRAGRLLLPVLVLLLLAAPAEAQSLTVDLGEGGSLSSTTIQIFLLLTVLSLAPGLAIMLTCFPFVVTVLSILRQGIGLQQSPPNMLIVSLAMFLTWFVMAPVFTAAWEGGVAPFLDGATEPPEAIEATLAPFRGFMAARMDGETYASLAALRPDVAVAPPTPDSPLSVLIPSFMLSEVSRAFQVGFLIFLPFLIIDLVVAAVLMSMGMMMVPPAVVSLPFKLAFFVIADGWTLLAESLVRSYL